MKLKDAYAVFVTGKLKETKNFYCSWFDFKIHFESSYFILLEATAEKPYYIGFMDETHPSSPPATPAITSNSGAFLTLEVADVQAEYERLMHAGIDIYYPLKDEVWGQRRFGVSDPNGMYIDIVQQIEPKKGYWEYYVPKE